MSRQSTNQNHFCIWFSGSDVTGWHYQLVNSDVAERRKQLELIGWNSGYCGGGGGGVWIFYKNCKKHSFGVRLNAF